MEKLLNDIANCTLCQEHLVDGCRPVADAHPQAKLMIIGQAPGRRVHESGIPWDDPSGDRLRSWLKMDKEEFYDREKVAIMPMAFCFPGTGKSGDLPPRPECAPLWHPQLLPLLPNIKLTLLIGLYAQKHYLGKRAKKTLTETVRNWSSYLDEGFLPLPHPSPRNQFWLKNNPWFKLEVLPHLIEQLGERQADGFIRHPA
jgi:uracil-DNA glycosylase family 4